MACPHCGHRHPPDGICLEPIESPIKEAFGVPLDELDEIRKVVTEAVMNYGDDDGPTLQRIRVSGIWNDHIAVQAGIAVYKMKQEVQDSVGLTAAQRERLEMLAEEAGEIVQICMKILRHGYESHHPKDFSKLSNRYLLLNELKDLWAIYEVMALRGDLEKIDFFHSRETWERKLRYTHHQGGT